MKTVYDYIASEIMDVIERERRINKDDLILAAEMGMRKHKSAVWQNERDNRLAELACADTRFAVEQAKIDEAAKREFYSKSLQQMIDAQRAAISAKETEPLVKAWWEGAAGGGSTWTGPTRTVVVGVDPAKGADASYYGITPANAPDWMKV